MEVKSIYRVEGLDELQLPASSVVAVAVSGSRKDRHTVKWALEKFANEGINCFKLLHIRPFISRIPTPLGNFLPISQVREDVADAFRKEVEWQVNEKLLPCKKICEQRKVRVEVVQIESDDVVGAVAAIVNKQDIKKLVISASSQGIFSRGKTLSSRISEACPSSCTVYVVSKGKLSSLRPSDSETNTSFRDNSGLFTDDDSSQHGLSTETFSMEQSPMGSFSSLQPALLQLQRFQALSALNQTLRVPSNGSLASTCSSLIDEESNVTDFSPYWSDTSAAHGKAIAFPNSPQDYDSSGFEASTSIASVGRQVNVNFELEKLRVQLRHIRGMYATAQGEAIDASRKLNELAKRRMEEEANLKQISRKEEEAIELARQENEKYGAAKREAEIVKHCAEIEARAKREADMRGLRETIEKQSLESALNGFAPRYRHFSWEEIVSATSSFSDDLKIGMGAYGTVYKCNFQQTMAAVKVLHSKEASRNKQFEQELEILSQIRHPNLLILLGACPDHGCLVYELMENGSLEDRLMRKHDTPPLPWFDRFRIAWEVASALNFLHHSKPRAIIHRDLKPANILLDRNNVSKIGDVGLSVMVSKDHSYSIAVNDSAPVGTLCYIDPEIQRTGVVSPKSDVYALGMVILQLLTAKPAIALAHTVEVAVENDSLMEVLDEEAGSWPVEETKELAGLALKCAELRRMDRPDLQDVLIGLEKMKEMAEESRDVAANTAPRPPDHFMCPILKEVMTDPCVAADGYTYDRKAIEGWVEENGTSFITGKALAHKGLIPNYALLSAIMEWNSGKRT